MMKNSSITVRFLTIAVLYCAVLTLQACGTVANDVSDANLKSLTVNTGTMIPNFDPNQQIYSVTASSSTTLSFQLTPTTNDTAATVTVDGQVVPSGTASAAVSVAPGGNRVVNTVVLAEDGQTTKTYSVTFVVSSSN